MYWYWFVKVKMFWYNCNVKYIKDEGNVEFIRKN